MKDAFASKFEITLRKMQWPNKDLSLVGHVEQEWSEGVRRLLELQEPELNSYEKRTTMIAKHQEDPPVLLPLEVMIKPLELRFKYHFEGDKPTNRKDKVCIAACSLRSLLIKLAGILSFSCRWYTELVRRVLCRVPTADTVRALQRLEHSAKQFVHRFHLSLDNCSLANAATQDPELPSLYSKAATAFQPFHT